VQTLVQKIKYPCPTITNPTKTCEKKVAYPCDCSTYTATTNAHLVDVTPVSAETAIVYDAPSVRFVAQHGVPFLPIGWGCTQAEYKFFRLQGKFGERIVPAEYTDLRNAVMQFTSPIRSLSNDVNTAVTTGITISETLMQAEEEPNTGLAAADWFGQDKVIY
jgi:hypothetical protein